MSQNEADGLEHAQPKVGAFFGIFRRTQTATFLIENVGCKPSSHANPNPCLGGSVDSFSLESMRNPVGLIFE